MNTIPLSPEQIRQLADEISRRLVSSASITPRWLKLRDASRYCGLAEKTIRRRINDGSISSKMVRGAGAGRGVRLVDRLSIDSFIERFGDETISLPMNSRAKKEGSPESHRQMIGGNTSASGGFNQ